MTESEKITKMISEKFFLAQYIYTDVYTKKESQEQEFCDCIIEFKDIYIIIQIKERNMQAKSSEYKWFKKKVEKNAKKQIKDTFNYFKDEKQIIYSKTAELNIDRNKTLIPVIVFLNDDIENYPRIVTSESINIPINIFKYNDFKIMLETIVMPRDIFIYLQYRAILEEKGRKPLLFDEVNKEVTIIGKIYDEKDYSEFFLSRTFHEYISTYDIHKEYIDYYNEFVSKVNEARGYVKDGVIEGFLYIQYQDADRIARNIIKCIELAKENKFVEPYKFSVGDHAYLFVPFSSDLSIDEINLRLEIAMIFCRYKFKSLYAHIFTFKDAPEDQFCLELCDVNLETDIRYEEYMEDVIKAYELNK